MEGDIVQIISQVGFPIFVAVYTLFRLEKTVGNNTKVMLEIASKLNIKHE